MVDKPARIRWTILLIALGATVAAMVYPVHEPVTAAMPSVRAQAPKAPVALRRSEVAIRGVWEPLLADPFAPRRWEAPAPRPPTPIAVAAPPSTAPEPVAPAGPPPLPFQFVGRMSDSTDQVVYLARDDQALLARTGAVLEGTYKVVSIAPDQIEFEHLPTGQKQILTFPTRTN